MEDLGVVLNENGVVLYVNPMTDSNMLRALLNELGGWRGQTNPGQIPIYYGNGLTKKLAERILQRHGVPL